MTKRDLKGYLSLAREIQELKQELQDLYIGPGGSSFRTISRRRKGGRPKRDLSDPVAHMMALEELLEGKYGRLKAERQRIEDALDSLPADERVVVRMRYFRGYAWNRIQLELNRSEASVTRAHSRALQRLLNTAENKF